MFCILNVCRFHFQKKRMQFSDTDLKSVNTEYIAESKCNGNSSYFAIFLRIIDGEWFGKNTEIPTFSVYFQEKSTVRVPKSWQEPHVQHEILLQKLGPKMYCAVLLKEGNASWITYEKSYLYFGSNIQSI